MEMVAAASHPLPVRRLRVYRGESSHPSRAGHFFIFCMNQLTGECCSLDRSVAGLRCQRAQDVFHEKHQVVRVQRTGFELWNKMQIERTRVF